MAILNGLADFVAQILSFFYSLPVVGGSYGLAIILLTLTIMVLLMPLTLKATRSTIKMQHIQPEMRRVQKEFKGDREQMNAELMKLYSQHGINPVGGCLPMVAQMPVFIVLFRVLNGLTTRVEDQPFFEVANKIREAQGLVPINGQYFDPAHLSEDSELYRDLTTHTEMTFGPFDLAAHTMDVVRAEFVEAIPYLILILVMVALSFYQQRQITARRSSDVELSPMLQQQQQIMKFLPLMTGAWAFFFPAGLVLYWTTSSVFRIGQQAYISARLYPKTETPTSDVRTDRSVDAASSPSAVAIAPATERSEPDADDGSPELSASQRRVQARQDAWDRRRQTKAKQQAGKASDAASSRITPKGTQPGSNPSRNKQKKKR